MKLEILKKEQAIADSLLAPYKDEQTGAAEIQAKKNCHAKSAAATMDF